MYESVITGVVSAVTVLVVSAIALFLLRGWIAKQLVAPIVYSDARIDASPFDKLGIDWAREIGAGETLNIEDRLIVSIKASDHTEIWDGFVGTFYAVNAPWVVDGLSDRSRVQLLETHAKRYSSGACNAIYIYYTNGHPRAYYPNATANAAQFWKDMAPLAPAALDHISVLMATEPAPNYTLFVGSKKSATSGQTRLVSIIYVGSWPFTHVKGDTNRALVCFDQALNRVLLEECSRIEKDYASERIGAEQFITEVLKQTGNSVATSEAKALA